MATFFSSQIVGYWLTAENYMYGTLTGDVTRSGNIVTLSNLYLSISFRYSATGSGSYTFYVNGTPTTWTMQASSPSHSINDTSFSVTSAQTSANISWVGSDGYQGSFTVTFPAGSTPPTDLAVSVVEPKPEGAVLGVSISSYGDPASATGRYIEAAILTGNNYYSTRRVESVNDVLSANIEVDNESSGNLTIVGNTQYYYGGYANNTVTQSEAVFGQFVTTAYPATLSLTSVDINSATVGYSVQADGGFYTKTLEYSLDNGSTWATAATISSGSATSGSFNITGLTAGTEYTLKSRVKTTAGNTLNTDLTIQTLGGFYGSVGGNTKLVEKLYGSVSGQTKKVIKFYGSVNGLSKKIF